VKLQFKRKSGRVRAAMRKRETNLDPLN